MGCSKCKENKGIQQEIYDSTKLVEKKVIIFVVIWFLFGLYGVYSLITKFL